MTQVTVHLSTQVSSYQRAARRAVHLGVEVALWDGGDVEVGGLDAHFAVRLLHRRDDSLYEGDELLKVCPVLAVAVPALQHHVVPEAERRHWSGRFARSSGSELGSLRSDTRITS